MSKKNKETSPDFEESYDEDKGQQAMFESKREMIFARMQGIYDLAKVAEADSTKVKALLHSAFNIDQLHKDFEKVLDSYNAISLKINPKHAVRYQEWMNFDIMYCLVKQVIANQLKKCESAPQLEKSKPKLPRIELLSFNGDVRSWPLFYQQFKCTVHENTSLSDSDKVYYLVGKLSGSAASVCARLPPTAENYPIIWEALVQKYDDPRLLASSYLNQLFNFKPLTANNATGLESFLDNFDTSVEALRQLSLGDLTDFMLLHIALQRLDSETVKLFEITHRKDKIPTYSNLIEFVKEQSKVLSRSAVPTINPHAKHKARTPHIPTPSSRQPQTKSFVSTDQVCGTRDESMCGLCHRDKHDHLYRCSAFMKLTPSDRYKFIKNNSFCNNCLSVKHHTMACMSKHTCSHCSARHHSLLHFNSPASHNKPAYTKPAYSKPAYKKPATAENPRHTASEYVSSAESNTRALPTPANDPSSTSVCTVSYDQNSHTITTALLATAKIKVLDSHNRPHLLRCLVDPGSQSEYISAACSKRLSLPISTQSRFSKVQGIGGASQKILGVTSLKFSSRFDDGHEYHIQPMVVDSITSQLPDSPIDISELSHIQSLPMADDDFSVPGPIDLLLGVNLYCQILLSNKITANNNNLPAALETTLGYIVMGNALVVSPRSSSHTLCAFTTDPLRYTNWWKGFGPLRNHLPSCC